MKKITTLQDKINLIVKRRMITPDDVIKMPIETFEIIYKDLNAMIAAENRVEDAVLLYGEK